MSGKRGEVRTVKTVSGGAVSLYLPGHVKHLHDLAMQDPNIKCSELYALALQSALGDSESKHPLELMRDAQKTEVAKIQEMLNDAMSRLNATEARLPSELAKLEWIANALGSRQLSEMKCLRLILFFDGSAMMAHKGEHLPRPKTVEEGLLRYQELLSRYEATKNGPLPEPSEIVQIENLHPEGGWNREGLPICVDGIGKSDSESTCGHTFYGKTGEVRVLDNGKKINVHGTVFNPSKIGSILGDDLCYRCPDCWAKRQQTWTENPGNLKPHWETEELTQAQKKIASEMKSLYDVGGVKRGMIQLHNEASRSIRKKAIVQYAIKQWESEYPEEASILEELELTRIGVNERLENGNPAPTWAGLPEKGDLRRNMINRMTPEEKADFKANNEHYHSISMKRSSYIREAFVRYQSFAESDLAWKSKGYEEIFDVSQFDVGWDELIADSYISISTGQEAHPDKIQDVHMELLRDKKKIEFSQH